MADPAVLPNHCRHASEGWHLLRNCETLVYMSKGGWTYILTNKPRGVLYIGVTSHLPARMTQHRNGTGSAFCRRYGIKRLVLAEWHETIEEAIAREKALKAWQRAWKIRLIEEANPGWQDLFEFIVQATRG